MVDPPPYDEPTPTAVWEPPDQQPLRALAAPPERRRRRIRVSAGAVVTVGFLGLIAAIIVAGLALSGSRSGGKGGGSAHAAGGAAAPAHHGAAGSGTSDSGSSGSGTSGGGTSGSGSSGSGTSHSGTSHSGTSAAGSSGGGSSHTTSHGSAGTSSGGKAHTTTTAAVPSLVGTGLNAAQDAARAAGFHKTSSHDVSGRDRVQIIDSDWRVCTQSPAAGTRAATTRTVSLGVVETDESCAGGTSSVTLASYRGDGADTAREALDATATVRLRDVSGRDRTVILAGNWTVCGSVPAAGSTYRRGATVTLQVVKTGESCP